MAAAASSLLISLPASSKRSRGGKAVVPDRRDAAVVANDAGSTTVDAVASKGSGAQFVNGVVWREVCCGVVVEVVEGRAGELKGRVDDVDKVCTVDAGIDAGTDAGTGSGKSGSNMERFISLIS